MVDAAATVDPVAAAGIVGFTVNISAVGVLL